ncbi:MAG: hypothetical protein KDA24_09070 [Deltaproteobacteria bacterium]|nr:hypothetical protein [Deltaproteobacteria bacterium]
MSPRVAEQLRDRRDGFRARWARDAGRELSLILIFVVSLATIGVGAWSAKVGTFSKLGRDDDATYWMESAQRFRYVRMVAEGEEIPAVDARMQAPDGYPTRSDTIGQELLYGTLARHRPPDWSIARFTRFLTRVIAASAVIPMAWLAWVVTRRRDASLLAALLYGLALPVAERGNGAVLYREDLAFPVLLFHIAALAGWARKPHWGRALTAGLFLAAALLLWKVVTFYSLLLLVFLASAWVFGRVEPGQVGLAAFGMFLPAVIASLGPWSLSYDQFPTSTPALAALGLTLAALLAARGSGLPRFVPLLVGVAVVFGGKLLLPGEASYTHAWETIVAKLTTFGGKPLDPTELSFHARHYWTGNYRSPTLRRLARDWPWLAAVAIPGLIALFGELRRAGRPWPGPIRRPPTGLLEGDGPSDPMSPLIAWFVLWLTCACVVSYLLFLKLMLFAAVPLALLGAVAWAYFRRLRWLWRLTLAPLVGLVALQGLGVAPSLEGLFEASIAADADSVSEVVVFPPDGFAELSAWVGDNTAEDEVVLASFHISPFLLTYLDRPTVLHCFFEGDLLERLETIVPARFATEEVLWETARSFETSWYVHEAHFTLRTDPRMSQRYVAAAMDWPADSASARMSFAPETLEHFELAWENSWFRVFRVLPEGERASNRRSGEVAPVWSRPFFSGLFGDPLKPLASARAGAGLTPDDLLYSTLKARSWMSYSALHRDPEAPTESFPEQEYGLQKAIEVAPYMVEAHQQLATLYSLMGRHERAEISRRAAQRATGVLRGTVPTGSQDAPRSVPRLP